MKTRKQVSKNPVTSFLKILHMIKLYHWNTKIYAQHKATDELHEKLSGLTDSYMEKYMGNNGRFPIHTTITYKQLSQSEFIHEIKSFRSFLVELKNSSTDLNNVRDEILGEVDQFLYLWTLQ